MKKKIILFFISLIVPLIIAAQDIKFGYFSYTEVLKSMPEYAKATADLNVLKQKYDEEAKRSETDFRVQYENFLEGQRNFAPTILKKRQAEIQDIMDRNIAFKKESERLLAKAEKEAFMPAKNKLNAAIISIGEDKKYAFIFNTDNNTLPYINKYFGEDITDLLKKLLK